MANYYIGGPQAKAILQCSDSVVVRLVETGRLKDYGVTSEGKKKHLFKFVPEDVHALHAARAQEEKAKTEQKLARESAKVQKLRNKAEQAALPISGDCGASLAALHAKVDALTAAVEALRGMWS